MKQKSSSPHPHDAVRPPITEVATTPECLSAALIATCHKLDHSLITELVAELSSQAEAIRGGDMARVESMLVAQAHALDSLFAKLASLALTSEHADLMEQYMRLALRSQSQSRATLQTLAEIKAPKQFAFVQQANIGSQVQVNNGFDEGSRAGEKQNPPNELLEAHHGERLEPRKTSTAGGLNPTVEAVAPKHWS